MAHRNPNRQISLVHPVRVLALYLSIAACAVASSHAQTAGFKIEEDGVFQPLERVSCASIDAPSVDIVFLIDVSGSMIDDIAGIQQQATDFALDITDAGLDARFGLISYGAAGDFSPMLEVQMTDDIAVFQAGVDELFANGPFEPAFDTLYFGVDQLDLRSSRLRLRKAIDITLGRRAPGTAKPQPEDFNSDGTVDVADVLAARSLTEEAQIFFFLFTDTTSNSDVHTESEVIDVLNEAGVTVFAISPDFAGSDPPAPGDLRRIAEKTGGLWIDIESETISKVLERIAGVLTSVYTIEYISSNPSLQPALRNVVLDVNDPVLGGCLETFQYVVPRSGSLLEPMPPMGNCAEVTVLDIDPSDFPRIKVDFIVESLAGLNCDLVPQPTPTPSPSPSPTPTPTPIPTFPFFVAVDFEGKLVHIDSRTAETRLIRDDLPRSIQSLATAPDGVMWATRTDPVTLTSEILQIDPVTGAFTAPVATTLRDARSLAISDGGTVYTVAGGATVFPMILSTLNLSNGVHSEIGELFGDETTVQGLAFAPDGRLFGIRPATPVDGNYSLVVIDTGTAEVVRMGRFVIAELGQSIAFAPDGRLFAIGGQIAELDPFDAAIIGFPTSIPGDFRGVEFLRIQSEFRPGD